LDSQCTDKGDLLVLQYPIQLLFRRFILSLIEPVGSHHHGCLRGRDAFGIVLLEDGQIRLQCLFILAGLGFFD